MAFSGTSSHTNRILRIRNLNKLNKEEENCASEHDTVISFEITIDLSPFSTIAQDYYQIIIKPLCSEIPFRIYFLIVTVKP